MLTDCPRIYGSRCSAYSCRFYNLVLECVDGRTDCLCPRFFKEISIFSVMEKSKLPLGMPFTLLLEITMSSSMIPKCLEEASCEALVMTL